MDAGSLTLVEVLFRRRGNRYAFDRSTEFPASWWHMEYPDDPNAHCVSVRRDGVEVARCKFQLYAESQFETVFGPMPEGRLDILALEVASSMRREGIGRSTLDALRREYPSPRFTALNDDATSRAFWDSIGWVRHEPKNPLLARVERVNYSEV